MQNKPKLDGPLPVWQSALMAHGCQIKSESQTLNLELRPVGELLVGTPTLAGQLEPFHVNVNVGEPLAIRWDSELSRYIVLGPGGAIAA